MNAFTKLIRRLRFKGTAASSNKDLEEARLDARTHDMIDGKGLSPTGAVMDFERDSRRP